MSTPQWSFSDGGRDEVTKKLDSAGKAKIMLPKLEVGEWKAAVLLCDQAGNKRKATVRFTIR